MQQRLKFTLKMKKITLSIDLLYDPKFQVGQD